MRRSDKFANPFYILLLIAGLTFAITAVAYGVMATRTNASFRAHVEPESSAPPHPLMTWMSKYGNEALITELAMLAVCTVGAIGTDEYWQRRAAAGKRQSQLKPARDR
jgi:hypothetical protein